MGVIVTFNYTQWIANPLYAGFASTVDSNQAQSYFDIATTIHRNDGGGPVNSVAQQLNLLNMLVGHLAALFAPPAAGQQPSTIVGRISSASQGSVSVQAAYSNNVTEQMAFFVQTKFGALYWVSTAPFRTMRYIPNKNRGVVGPPWLGV
jgi:hypothetical protein